MLRKLMKHEFRATGRIMLPLFLVVLVTAAGANISTRRLLEAENDFLNVLGMLLLMAFVVAIVGVCVMAFVLMVQRFHKNLFRDEGYVMHTLPVSVHQHVWSKILVSVVWFVVTALVVILACCIMAYHVGVVRELLKALGEMLHGVKALDSYYAINGGAFVAEVLVLMFLGGVSTCLRIYAAVAIGHSFSNHKVLWSIVFFFGIQAALQLVGTGLVFVVSHSGLARLLINLDTPGTSVAAMHAGMGIGILGSALDSTLFYFLTTYFLKKRLNLE